MVGVDVQAAQPELAGQPEKLPQQGRQLTSPGPASLPAFAPVRAVGGQVLGDQHQLPHPGGQQLGGLPHDLLPRAAGQRAADQGNGAVAAAVAAALRDFQVGAAGIRKQVPCGGLDGRRRGPGGRRGAQQALQALRIAQAHETVQLVQGPGELLAVARDQAAGQQDLLAREAALQLQGGADGLLLGAGDEAAGVHDHRLGPLRFRHPLQAGALQVGDELFGVHLVLGAAEAFDGEGHGSGEGQSLGSTCRR